MHGSSLNCPIRATGVSAHSNVWSASAIEGTQSFHELTHGKSTNRHPSSIGHFLQQIKNSADQRVSMWNHRIAFPQSIFLVHRMRVSFYVKTIINYDALA